jgi:hypothetical protein
VRGREPSSAPRPGDRLLYRSDTPTILGLEILVDELHDSCALTPIAVVTRFTDACRTWPAAKTPGTLVSSNIGDLSSGQRRDPEHRECVGSDPAQPARNSLTAGYNARSGDHGLTR